MNGLGVVVGALGAAAQDEMGERIALCALAGDLAVRLDGEVGVVGGGRLDGVERGVEAAMEIILKADRNGESRSHLAVGLGGGGAGADKSPTDQLLKVASGEWVEKLGRCRQF